MINIRKDLIQSELNRECTNGLQFQKLKPSNKFIDRIFNHYYVVEHTEHFYDSEPEFDDEEFRMYMDYDFMRNKINFNSGTAIFNTILHLDDISDKKDCFRYSRNEHTIDELEQAYKNIIQQIEDYKSHKIEFNNWVEPYSKGIWGMSQNMVDKISRGHLESVKKCSVSYNNRLYISEKDDEIFIYYYGRDFAEVDYWWIFKRKPKKKHKRKMKIYDC